MKSPLKLLGSPYKAGCRKPSGFPSFSFNRAISPLHNGATALVPPNTKLLPSTSTL